MQQFKSPSKVGFWDSRQDLFVNFLKLLFKKREVIEAEPEQQPVVVVQPIAFQCLNQLGDLPPSGMTRQIPKPVGVQAFVAKPDIEALDLFCTGLPG